MMRAHLINPGNYYSYYSTERSHQPISFMRTYAPHSTRDRSITRSLQRQALTKSSISQLKCIPFFFNKSHNSATGDGGGRKICAPLLLGVLLVFVTSPDGHGEDGMRLETCLDVHFLVEPRVGVDV